jgi:hypothetical protein
MDVDEVVNEYECKDEVRCDLEKNKVDLLCVSTVRER